MTQIELAQASARHRHEEYVKACQRVTELVRAKEEKAKSNIAKIRAAAEAKVAQVQGALKSVRTSDVERFMQSAVVAERSKMGLAS